MADERVVLTQERLKSLLHYDRVTGVFTWLPGLGGKGRPKVPRVAGFINRQGYRRIWVDGRSYQASRLAWLYVHGVFPPHQMDHEKRNTTDDRFEKLRPATQTQNKANSSTYKNNLLGVKGVRLHRNGRYEARLRIGGKLQYLGCYRTIEEAKSVYDAAARHHFGEFASPG